MDSLKETVTAVLAKYATPPVNGRAVLTTANDGKFLTVVGVGKVHNERFANTYQIVEIVDDYVIIHLDKADKIVADALVQAGIPRSKIILAYKGEPIPEAA
jgi:hypothetical protein